MSDNKPGQDLTAELFCTAHSFYRSRWTNSDEEAALRQQPRRKFR
jgi:hypothetical protein